MGSRAGDPLNSIRVHLRLDSHSEAQILRELSTHLEEEIQDLKESGLPEAEAAETATERFGSPRAIAQEMYRVHSKGSWAQACLAAFPHLLIALMFCFHLWQNGNCILAISVAVTTVAIYGWWRGKPTWFYPWLGYSLVPILIGGLLSTLVIGQALAFLLWGKGSPPSLWAWLAVLAYVPLGLWIIRSVTVRVVRRDWIYGSLMALPLPVLGAWLWSFFKEGRLLEYDRQKLESVDPGLVLAFLALALSAVAFVRLRGRLLKFGALALATLVVPMMILFGSRNGIDPTGLLLIALFMIGFLLLPALLELALGHERQETGTENGWNDLEGRNTYA